jgi:hypothetical protein
VISVKFSNTINNDIRKLMFGSADRVVKATAKGLWDTGKGMRTQASTEIRSKLELKKSYLDKRIWIVFGNKKRNGKAYAGIVIKANRPISLGSGLKKKPKQTPEGVTYILRKGKETLIPSAFGPKITKLHGSIYVRATKARKPLMVKQYVDLFLDMDANAVVHRVSQYANSNVAEHIKRRLNEINLREQGKIKRKIK